MLTGVWAFVNASSRIVGKLLFVRGNAHSNGLWSDRETNQVVAGEAIGNKDWPPIGGISIA